MLCRTSHLPGTEPDMFGFRFDERLHLIAKTERDSTEPPIDPDPPF